MSYTADDGGTGSRVLACTRVSLRPTQGAAAHLIGREGLKALILPWGLLFLPVTTRKRRL